MGQGGGGWQGETGRSCSLELPKRRLRSAVVTGFVRFETSFVRFVRFVARALAYAGRGCVYACVSVRARAPMLGVRE